jgi:hypothetical protein
MTLREILREKNVPVKVVADALGIHPNNIARYDDLMRRSVDEVMTISKATGIDLSELIGVSIAKPEEPLTVERLFSVIESQQRAIEKLSNNI